MKKKIQITAHAGCEGTEPNTWESLKKALELPCDYIEMDIRKKDGELWLSHNQMESTKGVISFIDAIDYLVKEQKSINCDLKEPIFEDVYEILKKHAFLNKAIFSGSVTQKDIKAHPEVVHQIMFNIENIFTKDEINNEDYEWIIEKYKKLGLQWMNIDYQRLNPCFFKRLGENKIKVSVWTVDQETHIEKMIQSGVSNITTHNVKLLACLLKRSGDSYE